MHLELFQGQHICYDVMIKNVLHEMKLEKVDLLLYQRLSHLILFLNTNKNFPSMKNIAIYI